MEELNFLGQDSFVPELRSAARLLLVFEGADAHGNPLLNGRSRGASALKKISEIAENVGHQVVVAPGPELIDNEPPEVIVVDGNSRQVVANLQTLRADTKTSEALILALIPSRMRDELLEALRAAGADDFINIDAQSFEVMARLEMATSLSRSRTHVLALRDQLARQIRVDDLTGVMSRRFFFQQAHRECSRARRYGHRLSCVMIEIDHFKSLTTIFGDVAGEAILRQVANIIGQWTRDSDLVSRFTEAKFAVLLPETGIEGATRAQDKITQALAIHQWIYEGRELPVTVSIGEAELQPGATFRRVKGDYISEGDEIGDAALSTRESLAGLLEDADSALYVARRGARMPEVLVPYTPVPEIIERPQIASRNRKPKPKIERSEAENDDQTAN